MICDLKSQRGLDEVDDIHLNMVFYAVRDFRRGTLPSSITDNPEMMKFIRKMAEQLPITESTKREDIKATVSPDVAKEFWTKRNKVSNFLKHADRDASDYISTDEVENLFLLMLALAAYSDLTSDNIGPEGFVLWLYSNVDKGMIEGMPTEYQELATNIESLSRNERLNFCSVYLNELKE